MLLSKIVMLQQALQAIKIQHRRKQKTNLIEKRNKSNNNKKTMSKTLICL